jgi:hypothetical protein
MSQACARLRRSVERRFAAASLPARFREASLNARAEPGTTSRIVNAAAAGTAPNTTYSGTLHDPSRKLHGPAPPSAGYVRPAD